MIIDARSLSENEFAEADICIVGAGTAGFTLAKEFINQSFNVILLESGGLKPDRETQALYRGKNIGHPYFTLDSARARYFGGSTNRWAIPIGYDCSGVRMRPFDALDFKKRDWVPYSGWPFDKTHLDPFYDRAQALCQITPTSYDVIDWAKLSKVHPFPLNNEWLETVIFKFASRRPFLDVYAGEIAAAPNISVYLHANVTNIETNESVKKVTRMRVACLEGTKFWVKAKHFILAAGAIEIPRLMLASNRQQGAGLGNQNDLVGRFFMEHAHFSGGFFLPSSPGLFNTAGLYNRIRKVNGVAVIGKLALSEGVQRREQLLNHVIELSPKIILKTTLNPILYPAIDSTSVDSLKAFFSAIRRGTLPETPLNKIKNIISGIDDIGVTVYRGVKKRMLRTLDKRRVRLYRLENMAEQIPNPQSRVILGRELDSLGQRRANLDWRLSDMDTDSIIRSHAIIDQELRRSGLGRLLIDFNDGIPRYGIKGGWHHMGTTRMHTDPKQGVVDPNCRVYGVSNLFIAGPSVFPTGGYANPSLTIVALAMRLADHLKGLIA